MVAFRYIKTGTDLIRLLAVAAIACQFIVTGSTALAQRYGSANKQSNGHMQAALAMQDVLVNLIANSEKSVVAIARVHIDKNDDVFSLEASPHPFGGRHLRPIQPEPGDPNFIPNDYAAGVVVGRGLILTAFHTLADESEYYVTTHNRRTYRATIKAADPRSDLAILKIDAVDLPAIKFGDASKVKKGQIAISLGNPHAIARDGQVCAAWGIISNLARKSPQTPDRFNSSSDQTLHQLGTLIQTDAKLNQGTSGGPLLNLHGEMIGMNVALANVAGQEPAAGYAIPINKTFRRIIEILKKGREVEYGFLGIQPSSLSQVEILAGIHGVRVERIVGGTPASQSTIEPNDIITTIDGKPIYGTDSFSLALGLKPAGAKVRMLVLRKKRTLTVDIELSKFPSSDRKIVTNRPPDWRGMRVDYPTARFENENARSAFGFPENVVFVSEVQKNSPAWNAGMRPGMFISHVGRQATTTPAMFRKYTSQYRRSSVQLRIDNDDKQLITITTS